MARPRKRNPRRVVLEVLREQKKLITRLQNMWDVTGEVYIPMSERAAGDSGSRQREDHEYPENQRMYWQDLEVNASRLENMARQLRSLAITHGDRLNPPKDWSGPPTLH